MADTRDENSDLNAKMDALRELPLTESDPRFSSDEMIACKSCARQNPPTRTTCLYCGKSLDAALIRTDLTKLNYKRPEAWEDGFSLVYAGKGSLSDEVISQAAELLQMNVDSLKEILDAGVAIPLIYLRSLPDAELLASRLSQTGFDCAIVGDDLLQPKVPPTRVRSISFEEDGILLQDLNTSRVTTIKYDERILFAVGSLLKSSTEIQGKISKKALKTTAETLGVTDEAVIDIYPMSDVYGFRIRSGGFDFSCLGDKMQPFAAANINELISELRTRFASAVFIDSFLAVAPLIGAAWPLDEIKQASDVTRGPFGGVHKHTVTVLDNTSQFTKFSRLQRHFV